MLRFSWRGAPLPIPYPATRRSWSWDGKAMKRLSEERTGLSVWWKEAGWRQCESSGKHRTEKPPVRPKLGVSEQHLWKRGAWADSPLFRVILHGVLTPSSLIRGMMAARV